MSDSFRFGDRYLISEFCELVQTDLSAGEEDALIIHTGPTPSNEQNLSICVDPHKYDPSYIRIISSETYSISNFQMSSFLHHFKVKHTECSITSACVLLREGCQKKGGKVWSFTIPGGQ